MQTPEAIGQTLSKGRIFVRPPCAPVLLAAALLHLHAAAAAPTFATPESASQKAIPWSEVGTAAAAQYSGDGLKVTPTRDGARLRCVFQRMEGEATPEGLWLGSTSSNQARDRFRVTAIAYGRAGSPLPADGAHGVTRPTRLPETGNVSVDGQTVRFMRPGLVEEYSVSMDGVRQDFVVLERTGGASVPASRLVSSLAPPVDGELRVDLAVTGARVEPTAQGARLILQHSGRQIAYSRLRVTDATGRELSARMEAIGKSEIGNRKSEMSLAILVDDADATYPVRIDPTFSDANWISMGGLPGTDGYVYAVTTDTSGNLYIGGNFTAVADVVASGIAKWNGRTWSALGSGISAPAGDPEGVLALVAADSDLYVGGQFTTAGGVAATNIAKWDGSSWSALGLGITGSAGYPNYGGLVLSLAVSGSEVFVGGRFTEAGGVSATNIAKWNGSGWSALGSGITAPADDPWVSDLAISGNDLYAGGHFTTAGGMSATNIAKWDGSSWSALGSGIGGGYDPVVLALEVSGGDLYAGGHFTTAGGVAANNIAKWNGSSWSPLGAGLYGLVLSLAVSGSDLYAGGESWVAGTWDGIAKWNGSSWTALGPANSWVHVLEVLGSDLYVGGRFTTVGGVEANHIAKWNESGWSALSSGIGGLNQSVSALAVSGSDLYAAGSFTAAGHIFPRHIAKWNGSSWSALGSGIDGWAYALAVSGSDLYVGGDFWTVDGVSAAYIAKWDGSGWSALGAGMNGNVRSLAVSGSDLYAAGEFTMAGGVAAHHIAKWDGNNWSPLGSGMTDSLDRPTWISALAVSGSNLYACGNFAMAGGVAAVNIAKWNGASWSPLGSGLAEPQFPYSPIGVFALAVSGSDLYAGGSFFHTAGGVVAANIAKWNGSSWSALGSGMNDNVYALAASGSNLYAGGRFTTAGGVAANSIAKWNGSSWSALGSGMNGLAVALAVSGSDLYAGGDFTMAGGKVSAYLARAIINPPVLTLEHSASGTNFIRFSGVPGTAYHLQRAPNLAGPWPNIATNIAPATGRIEVGDGSPSVGQGFYRVVEP